MGKVIILPETTRKPITLIGRRAGICYNSNISDDEKNYKRGLDCINKNHGRTLEFVNIEMVLDGYSARVIREWYTSIGGLPTRLQSSTRYINYNDFDFTIPPSIAKHVEADRVYKDAIKAISDTMYILDELGMPREDVAMLLPLGMCTKIVDKRNLRSLIDMSRVRMCQRAYWEYRQLMSDIRNELSKIDDEWKYIVDNFICARCDECNEECFN